ncbi:hypothetical protein YC2023_115507 [Brassica napus]
MVLIFHSFKGRFTNFRYVFFRWFSSSTWICTLYLSMIYMFFRSGSDFGRPMGSLLGSLLKYNVLEDFLSRRLQRSHLDDFQEVF